MLFDALLEYIKLRDHERWRDFVWRFSVCVSFAMRRFRNEKIWAFIRDKLEYAYGFRMQHLPAQTVRYCMASVFVIFFDFELNAAKRAHSEARRAKR